MNVAYTYFYVKYCSVVSVHFETLFAVLLSNLLCNFLGAWQFVMHVMSGGRSGLC